MNKRNVTLIFFLVMCAIQWIFPIRTILSSNSILSDGELFKFLTAPVDPNDPFRGKYVALDFKNNSFLETKGMKINRGDEIYITLDTDEKGYAQIEDYSLFVPDVKENHLKVTIRSIQETDGARIVFLDFPFNRFYLEESKAASAEENYRIASRNQQSNTWAEVYIKDGRAVLHDVKTEGVSIVDF